MKSLSASTVYDRQVLFNRHTSPMPVCPSCDNEQVQIMGYDNESADWKCRGCNHSFKKSLPTGERS